MSKAAGIGPAEAPGAVFRGRLVSALAASERAAANAVVADALAAHLEPSALLLEVLGGALREVGERWHRGELSVAQEHWASEVVLELVERVRQAAPTPRPNGLTVVVAAPQGEHHGLAARLISVLLHWRGWHTYLLGADVPLGDLVAFAERRDAHAVALSVTLRESLAAAAAAAERLAALPHPPVVLLGGAALGDPPELPAGWPRGVLAVSAREAGEAAEQALGRGGPPDLAGYLQTVGGRIARLRRERAMSQVELAAGAALARSYLSAVESGRQNITLDAALRLSRVLAVPVGELLREEPDVG